MSDHQDQQEERPCLHCLIVDQIDNFYAEYPVTAGETDAVDTDEVIVAVAKTIAELTCGHDGVVRQNIIEQLKREIINYDAQFRKEDEMGNAVSNARH